jgi:hypothetical protein
MLWEPRRGLVADNYSDHPPATPPGPYPWAT